MRSVAALEQEAPTRGFRHEAWLYEGEQDFVSLTAPFLRDAVAAGEPALVMVSSRRIDLLREELGEAVGEVRFTDMGAVGRNPARIIPAWQDFIASAGGLGRRLRGIGEPIWPERPSDELAECQLHEALLNSACAKAESFWLACPYDASALDPAALAAAALTHPYVVDRNGCEQSREYQETGSLTAALGETLPEPPPERIERAFDAGALAELRDLVASFVSDLRYEAGRSSEFVLAVHEVATNSVQHGGGTGLLRLWRQGSGLVCEVSDRGRLAEPLAGRLQPGVHDPHGRGLWMAHQLCDLVQVRTTATGTVVRLHLRRRC